MKGEVLTPETLSERAFDTDVTDHCETPFQAYRRVHFPSPPLLSQLPALFRAVGASLLPSAPSLPRPACSTTITLLSLA